jgi:mannose-6-phosphate isomerase-like protein (cupin superfamily)
MTFPKDGYHLSAEDGDSWWFLDTRMTVKVSASESGGAFTLLDWSAPKGFGPPRHVHEHEDEVFYLLDGEMRVICGSKQWDVSVGSLVFLPRGIEHAYLVTSDTPVRGLQITSPAGFEDFIAELGRRPDADGLPAPEMPDIARLDEVARRHGKPSVGPPLTL